MTAAEHIAEAERLRGCAGDSDDLEWRKAFNDAALVHATLAVAEATLAANRLRPAPSYGGPR